MSSSNARALRSDDPGSATPVESSATRTRDAYTRLRVAILSGELEAGRSYGQAALSDILNVGRTPLREAVRQLQAEGLLESEPNRKIRIAPLDLGGFTQLYALRLPVEALACRLSVPRLTDADIEELQGLLDRHIQACDDGRAELAEELHGHFHQLVCRYAGERVYANFLELSEHADRYSRQYYGSRAVSLTHLQLVMSEHLAIMEACAARDGESAARLVAQHLARAAVTLVVSIDSSFGTEDIQAALRMILS